MSPMDVDDKLKNPTPLPAMNNKKPPPSTSFLSEVQVFSLVMALVSACNYAVLAAYNLRDRHQHAAPLCQEPEPVWARLLLIRCVVVTTTGADDVVGASSHALWRGIMWCSALQAAAAALALALIAAGRGLFGVRRAAAFVALAATAASHWMYASVLGRVDSPRDILLVIEFAGVVAMAAFDLLGFLAFVLGRDE